MASTNIDPIIESVDIERRENKNGRGTYAYVSIKLEGGEELKWFPEDRSLSRRLEQEIELKELRESKGIAPKS